MSEINIHRTKPRVELSGMVIASEYVATDHIGFKVCDIYQRHDHWEAKFVNGAVYCTKYLSDLKRAIKSGAAASMAKK